MLLAFAMASCVVDNNDTTDSEETQTVVATEVDETKTVTGVAVDGAMNSIYLKVGNDTMGFSYPDLDNEHRNSWSIDDTVTIKYVVTNDGDSVTDVIVEES